MQHIVSMNALSKKWLFISHKISFGIIGLANW